MVPNHNWSTKKYETYKYKLKASFKASEVKLCDAHLRVPRL